MAWLGQLTSIKDKISDFTKDVILNDNADVSLSDDKDSEHLSNASSINIETLREICREQEIKINQLFLEKEGLENNIVTLDEQNQEALNELLSIKQKLSNENKQLKKQISEQGQQISTKNDNDYPSSSIKRSFNLSNMDDINFLLNDLNILSILGPYSKCQGDGFINEQIKKLESAKHILESKDTNTCPEYSNVLSKINIYTDYLQLMCIQKQTLLPVVEEIATIMCKLCKNSLGVDVSKLSCDNNAVHIKNTTPTCTQTECSLSYMLSESSQTDTESNLQLLDCVDVSCETENVGECSNCLDMCSQLEILKSENKEIVSKFSCLEKEVEFNHTNVQTDHVCQCEELQVELESLLMSKKSLEEDFNKSEQVLLQKLHNQAEVLCNMDNEISVNKKISVEKDDKLNLLKEEISNLKSQIKSNLLVTEDGFSELNNGVKQNHFIEKDESLSSTNKLLLHQVKTLELEKNKLVMVLSEKSQECSSLKSEVHKLTNIVASEKQALCKLQKDNFDLRKGQESTVDVDLTKEALQNLSQLVRDKDMEIEALTQKNQSLTAVIEQSNPTAEQLQPVASERDDLLQKVSKFKFEREKIMASYNNKDQEWRQQVAEVKTLTSDLESVTKKLDVLEQQHFSLSQQYEEKQVALINSQNDVIILKQRLSDLDKQMVDNKAKYDEMLTQVNSNSLISKEELMSKVGEVCNLETSLKEKDDLIHEKDCLIHELSQQVKGLKSEMEDLRIGNADQATKLSESEVAIKRVWDDKESVKQKLQDKQSELTLLKEHNERLNMSLKEKEFLVQSLDGKIASLSQIIRGNNDSSDSPTDIDQILTESKEMYSKAQSFHRERDESLLALSQCQQENESLKSEVQKLNNHEDHLKKELNRLRKHLLQIEEHYTNEALKAELREKELRNQVVEAEKTANLSSSAVLESSHHSSIQIASLQEQVAMIASQRDRALAQSSTLEDKVQEYAASLSNLQLVLEQMQKGNEQKLKDSDFKHLDSLKKVRQQCLQLQKVIDIKQLQLEESSKALEAASRLSEQIDAKEDIITHLKSELRKIEGLLRSSVDEISAMKNSTEGKVDRVVMKSLVLGYFSTPPGQKSEVVRLLARVLDFNQQEMAKAGIVVGRTSRVIEQRGYFSSFFGRLPLVGHSSDNQSSSKSEKNEESAGEQQSFATLFVKFLENESQPIVPIPLPAEKMARELTSKAHQTARHSSRNSSLLLTPERNSLLLGVGASFPTFSPVLSSEYTSPAPTILQEVLE